jgi:hypothetical protein
VIRVVILLVVATLVGAAPARAARLAVGPTRPLALPSDAARIARDGDTVAIDPGDYVDCAVWNQRNLRIEGTGAGVVIHDKLCANKAIFVTVGDDITVANLTLAGARSPSRNGAGIRAEGRNLTIENSRFIGNEDGILTADSPDSTLRVSGSEFRDNGSCAAACAHGIYAGHIRALRVEGSRFVGTREGHHIKSRAMETAILDKVIEDGPNGTSSYLIDIPNGGATLIVANRMEKGRGSENPDAAISIGAEGSRNPTQSLVVRDNRFTNDEPGPTVFVRNLTAADARLSGNAFAGPVQALLGPGTVQ